MSHEQSIFERVFGEGIGMRTQLLACDFAQHVLPVFEAARPGDNLPRAAIEAKRSWLRDEISWDELTQAAYLASKSVAGAFDPAVRAAAQATVHLAVDLSLTCIYSVGQWAVYAAGEDESKWQEERLHELMEEI